MKAWLPMLNAKQWSDGAWLIHLSHGGEMLIEMIETGTDLDKIKESSEPSIEAPPRQLVDES
jgi:hypothetical protein